MSVDEQVSNQSESGWCRHSPMVTHSVGGSASAPAIYFTSLSNVVD